MKSALSSIWATAIGVVLVTAVDARAQEPEAQAKTPAPPAFTVNLLFPCLTHVERGVPIAELPDLYKEGLTPAPPNTKLPSVFKSATAVWNSAKFGPLLRVLEFGPDKCVVLSERMQVEQTLRGTSEATMHLDPPFKPVSVKSGYWPIVYETERTLDGRVITVRLEGAEPGAPGHLYRFSLLSATVTARNGAGSNLPR